jgi:hypothetical protein
MSIGITKKREEMTKLRYPTLAFSALCAMAVSTAGWAQQAGTYSGTSADGSNVSFTVGTDSNNDLAVTGASINFTAPCKGGTTPTVYSGWGFGTDAVITKNKASMVASDNFFYITADLKFSGSTVTGTVTTRVPDLDPGSTPPTKADFCESPKQAFSATLNGTGPSVPDLPPGAMIHLQVPAQH